MDALASLVAGRLGLAIPRDGECPRAGGRLGRLGCGPSRFGLLPPRAVPSLPRMTDSRGVRKKGTFRLPRRLLHRLKAFAATTGSFQCAIVAEALQQHLGGATAGLHLLHQAEIAALTNRYEAEADERAAVRPCSPQAARCPTPTAQDAGAAPDPSPGPEPAARLADAPPADAPPS
jgi:hypothetical protein